jgi:hypothetical protein
MLATACGALGFPEPRAPLSSHAQAECPEHKAAHGAAAAAPLSTQLGSALMP